MTLALDSHFCHVEETLWSASGPPEEPADLSRLRKKVEPWLSALLQSEHLSLLLGSGPTVALARLAGGSPVTMDCDPFPGEIGTKIEEEATRLAASMSRGEANLEDRLRAALEVYQGLAILGDAEAANLKTSIEERLRKFCEQVLEQEREYKTKAASEELSPDGLWVAFLLTFASRLSSRERLHIITTNYDRFIEHGADKAGIRLLDRFVGLLSPRFHSSRLEVDVHYNPPGIRGEPRLLEGVAKFTKLHGSVDWRATPEGVVRVPLPFGAAQGHPELSTKPLESFLVFPNSAKDIETAFYPYADLFRDFSAAVCRPSSTLVTYGYGFGDDHVNRVLLDMLTIPSTHLAILSYSGVNERIAAFLRRASPSSQLTILLGSHFGDLQTLVEHYLPSPSIDDIAWRRAALLRRRTIDEPRDGSEGAPPGRREEEDHGTH